MLEIDLSFTTIIEGKRNETVETVAKEMKHFWTDFLKDFLTDILEDFLTVSIQQTIGHFSNFGTI